MTANADKVAIITGASRGIGAAVAQRLANDGFTVIVNYAGNAAQAEDVVRKIEKNGGKALAAQADVSKVEDVQRMFRSAETAFGAVDVLVNNAGIMLQARIADFEEEAFDRQVSVNLKGTFNTMREAGKRLRSGGRIINFSSSVIGLRLETYGVYSATKAAVEALTGVMSKEMRGRSITVNSVAPGPTGTELFLNGKSDELIDRLAKLNPLERLATPEDIANVVSFLAGPEGGWINGQTLRANGGMN